MDKIFKEIDHNLTDNSIERLTENLKIITLKLKDEENRIILNEDINNWVILSKILTHIFNEINDQNKCVFINKLFFDLMIEFFRVLRNSLINCPQSKESILTVGTILDNSFHVFQTLFDCLKDNESNDLIPRHQLIQTIKCCLQFFANSLSGLDEDQQELTRLRGDIWKLFSFDLFRELLEFDSDTSIGLISSMIFFSCIRNNRNFDHNLFETTKSEDLFKLFQIFSLFVKHIETESSEWSLWSIQLMLKIKAFLSNFYFHFEDKQKLILLDVIQEIVENENKSKERLESNEINDSNLIYLRDLFKQNIGDIVKIDSETEDSAKIDENKFIAIHISKLSSILCELTANQNYLNQLKTDKQLLERLVDTLKTIQLLGKSADSSHFKTLSQLKQISESDRDSQNPVFGFKRNIIRLIANIVYKCPQMQDWVRELDGIPLILDCCNIDAKNPYIMQWTIFAIKNILENNAKNQELLSQLSRNGVLIDDQLSKKIGLSEVK